MRVNHWRLTVPDNHHCIHFKNTEFNHITDSSRLKRWIFQSHEILTLIFCIHKATYSTKQTQAKSGAALQTLSWFIHTFINLVTDPLWKLSWQRRQAQTVWDGASSNKTDNITKLFHILNLKGYQSQITNSKVMAILFNGWILPVGGVALGGVCTCSLLVNRLNVAGAVLQTPLSLIKSFTKSFIKSSFVKISS